MWTRLLFVALVAASAVQAWNPHTGYSYKVQSRTLSALHQVGDQYSGMLMRANLELYAISHDRLFAYIAKPEYADVHQALPGGWGSPIPEEKLEWQPLKMTDKHFIIQFRNGVIDRIIVDPRMPEWELNMIKGIVSQLQVDSAAENSYNSRINQLPSEDSVSAVYKTMEDSVTGKCEVVYDISPLPEYILQSHPQLVPKPGQNPEDAKTLDIVKSTNYSNCEHRPVFHHGFGGENWEPASSKMGQFFARSSVSRVVVTGTPRNNLIQSAVTTNKVILSPAVYNNQKGMVVSRMNLTLVAAQHSEAKQRWESSEQPTLEIRDLVYDLTHPTNQQNQQQDRSSEERQQSGEQGQQKDSSEERMQGAAAQRFRRSLKPQQEEQQRKQEQRQHKHKDNQDSRASFESESEEDASVNNRDWIKRHPSMEDAPEIPFLPFFIGYKGQSINGKIDVAQKAAEIAREVAKELQNPKEVPQKATLAKFSILARLVQTMNAEQLQKVTEQLYTPSEKDAKAWKVYRDAVNQAGTAPALVAMKKWIDSKKVQGEEAAEMVAQIPKVALIPNKHYVHYFFRIASSEVVRSQRHLNTTAILSFADLVRKAQVDHRYAHNAYPTHTFGRMNPAQVPAVTRDYIPYLARQLRQAVRDGDSVRIQTYVRALGNLAHPKILSVLEPYLEGTRQVSDFQRLHMVMSLNKLVKTRPSLARAVLYRIYKNISETPEIRSAAVYLLMKTNPHASMLQRMAESTKDEHSKQVRIAVKTAIESSAALRGPDSWQLAENAQAAINALNNTNFGPEYSKIKLASDKVPEMNIAFRAGLAAIGSDDFLAPKATFAHFRQILSGLKLDSQSAGYMASSTKDLMNLIAAQSGKEYPHPEGHKGIESEIAQQVEANILLKTLQGERFFAFDNHTIERIPEAMKHMLEKLSQGQNFSLQKMYNKQSLTLAFPTASGLPFVYSLMTPTVASVEGKVQSEIQPEISPEWKNVKATANVKALYSTKTEAVMGFVAPFNSKLYTAGTDKDAQINLPIRAELEINAATPGSEIQHSKMTLKLQPLNPEQDTQVATLRNKAYTAQDQILDLKPTQQKPVESQKPNKRSFIVGRETTGMAFRVDAATEQESFDYAEVLRQLQQLNALTAAASFAEEKKIKNYEYTMTYESDKSRAKSVLLAANYGVLDKKPETDPYAYIDSERTKSKGGDEQNVFDDNLAIPTNSAPDSKDRLLQYLYRVADNLKISRAAAIDLSAQFKGEKKSVYIATVSAAQSPMQESYAALVYMRHAHVNGKQNAFAAFPKIQIPSAPLANFQQAIENRPTAYVETKITFAEDLEKEQSQIYIKTNLERTAEREQYVREQPISHLCQQQSGHGNNFLPACQNATLAAGHMDQYQFTVQYARIPESVKNATYKAYSVARHLGWNHHSEDLVSANNEERKISLNVRFSPNLRSANVSIHAPKMNAQFKNVRLSPAVSAAVVAHPNYKPTELVSRYVYGKSYYPTCTIDKSAVSTFNNKTFPLHLEEEWYLVAQYVPKQYQNTKYNPAKQVPFIKVQTRQSPTHQKEVKIFLGAQDTVEIFPRGAQEYPEIKVNNKLYKINPSKPTEVESKVDNRVFVRFYGLPSGTMRLVAPKYTLDIIYDTTTFVVSVGNQYRSDVRGLCGTFDGETETDFATPKKCIAHDTKLFIKSITVTGDGNLKHPNLETQPRECIYKKTSRSNAVSDVEAGREHESTFKPKSQNQQGCTSYRTKVVEHEGKVCFSMHPQPKCSSECQSTKQVEQPLEFHCMQDSSAARQMQEQAKKGVALNLSSKGANQNLTVKVPESCQA